MAIVEFRLDVKDAAYVAANPTLILADGEPIFLDDGTFAFGDGSTQLSGLTFHGGGGSWGQITGTLSDQTDLQAELDTKQDRVSGLVSGGTITIGDYDAGGTDNDIRVAVCTYFIEGEGEFTSVQTDFLNIANCASGNFKYIDIFGLSDGTVTIEEGAEGIAATHPVAPANSVRLGYVLWGDAGGISVAPEGTGGDWTLMVGYRAFSPLDSTTYAFMSIASTQQSSNRNIMLFTIPEDSTLTKVTIVAFASVAGSAASEPATLNFILIDNTTAVSLMGTGTAGVISTNEIVNDLNISDDFRVVPMSVAVEEKQRIRMEIVMPVFTTNPTNCFLNCILHFSHE